MKINKVYYFCDYCEKELGENEHFSIHINRYAGWVKPPKWEHKTRLEDRPYQFCGDKCLTRFLHTNSKCRSRPRKK